MYSSFSKENKELLIPEVIKGVAIYTEKKKWLKQFVICSKGEGGFAKSFGNSFLIIIRSVLFFHGCFKSLMRLKKIKWQFGYRNFENLKKLQVPGMLRNMTFIIQLYKKWERKCYIHFSRQFILWDHTKFLRVHLLFVAFLPVIVT